MYLSRGRLAPKDALFDVPHKRDPMTTKEILKELPTFAKAMDGTATENTLLFYYKKNKDERVLFNDEDAKETDYYIFQDQDAEEDVADMMGVEIGVFSEEEDEGDALTALSTEQIALHTENIAMIRDGLAQIG